MLRIIRWSALALIAVLAVGWGALWLRGHNAAAPGATQSAGGINLPGSIEVGGPFTLVDNKGQTVTDATYRGRWMLIYFGYTFCPDVCPTELQTVAASLEDLGPSAAKVAPIFITIDPERDTTAVLAEYVKLFDDRLVGLTGTPDQVAAAARGYRVYYARAASKDSSTYLMDHSSFLYLMSPNGKLASLFKPGTTSKTIADTIRAKLASS